jgi:NTP pyrophosphatase (non-canonical NTP hydrolase)
MKQTYRLLETQIEEWAEEKGILKNGTTMKQAEKTHEEVLELISAIDEDNREEIIDALGDVFVTLIIQAKMQKLDLLECLQSAYDVISKRSGVMKNGMFVKDKPAN